MLNPLVARLFQGAVEAIVRMYSYRKVPSTDKTSQQLCGSCEGIKSDLSAKCVCFIEQFRWRIYGTRKQKEIYF
jgi:hypothetical protein